MHFGKKKEKEKQNRNGELLSHWRGSEQQPAGLRRWHEAPSHYLTTQGIWFEGFLSPKLWPLPAMKSSRFPAWKHTWDLHKRGIEQQYCKDNASSHPPPISYKQKQIDLLGKEWSPRLTFPAWRLKLLLASGKVNPANPICVRPRLILVTFLIIVPAGHQSHVTTEAQQGFFFWWTIWHFFNNWSEKAKLSHLSALVALFDSLPSSIWDGTAAVLGPSEESVCRCGKAIIRSTFT